MAQDSGRAAEHGYGTARSGSAAQGSARARSLSTQNKPFMTSPQSYEVIVLGGGKGGKTLATELGNKSVKMALIERSAEPGVQLPDMPDLELRFLWRLSPRWWAVPVTIVHP